MTSQIDMFLLVFFLTFSLALLWRHGWTPYQPSHFKAGVVRTTMHRRLQPRTPDDCPLCRLASTPSLGAGPVPGPLRPWREVKSRRGAPQHIDTEGFACPNQQCPYFGITNAQIHALVGDGKHGHVERIQTFRCQACRTTFTCPSQHAPVSSENPFLSRRNGAVSASRRAGPFRCFAGVRLSTSYHHEPFCPVLPVHAHTLHERFFSNLHLPHL